MDEIAQSSRRQRRVDPAWSRRLLVDGDTLVRPETLRGAFAAPPFDADDIVEALRTGLGELRSVHGGDDTLIVFTEGEVRHAERDRALSHPPSPGESLSDWWERMFAGEMVTVIFDRIERFLDERAAAFVAPLLAELGVPSGGIEFSLHLCNGRGDVIGARARPGPVLFVPLMGPRRRLSLWDAAEFADLCVFHAISHAFEALGPLARTLELAVGDLAYVPANAGALIEPDALAATLMITWTDLSGREFMNRAIVSDCVRRLEDLGSYVDFDDADPESTDLCDRLLGGPQTRPFGDVTLGEWIPRVLESQRLELLSAAGLQSIPPVRDTGTLELRHATVVRSGPFPICVQRLANGRVALFARGRSFSARMRPALSRLVDAINAGAPVHVPTLLQTLEGEISEAALARLLGVLWMYRAIEVVASGPLEGSA